MNSLKNSILIVFKYLQALPKDKITTYKEVALACGLKNPRHVGWILSQNEEPEKIPCYKVVKSDYSLASGYKFGGAEEQRKRLLSSGFKFEGDKLIVDKTTKKY